MCAINGFNFTDSELILKMNSLTRHRGPDATGHWIGDGMSLGHNRLAIIDLSERGKQPMWDEGKEVVIVFNGEIYNYLELKKELEKRYFFQSDSDTEVLLCAYKEYGIECLNKLNGIFAFAIWDTRTKELFLARDKMGVNPLYYYLDHERFIFSSEIKGILAHNITRKVDAKAFNLYMQLLYVPEPYTMFRGIKKLPPASYLIWKEGEVNLQKYWNVENVSSISSRAEAEARIKELFRASVKRQLISDRPVGIFLSGGMDSTAVLGAASEFHDGKIRTFSVGFEESLDAQKFNADALLARKTALHYETDHHELVIGPTNIEQHLSDIAWHMDEPNANPTAAAMYLLSKLAKEQVAVVLGGDGGDELFGGYPRYYYSRLISWYQELPKAMQSTGFAMLRALGKGSAIEKLNLGKDASRVIAFLGQKEHITSQIVSLDVFDAQASLAHVKEKFFGNEMSFDADDFEAYFMQIDRQSWLPDESLLRTNKMTMAFGLEARVPILDSELVSLSARIPTEWKFSLLQRPSCFQGKTIWRDAIREYLPDHIANQQKRGWFTPMSKWMRGGLRETVSTVLSEEHLNTEFFDAKKTQTMWQDHLAGRGYYLAPLWAIVAWQLWYNRFMQNSR